jgi:hypothetical protein
LTTADRGSATPYASPSPGPSIFSNYSFGSTMLLTRMTGISLRMQWPLTSQSQGSLSLSTTPRAHAQSDGCNDMYYVHTHVDVHYPLESMFA